MDLGMLGGLFTRAQLEAAVGRRVADRAVREEAVVQLSHGRYALATVAGAEATAHALNGLLCLTSAALHHGWEVLRTPERPHVLFPRKRRLVRLTGDVQHHRRDVEPHEVSGPATSQLLTLQMCLQQLPLDEALAVADSALRHGVPPSILRQSAALAQGPGAPQARIIADIARAEAANPFESGLRAIGHGIPGLDLRPQVTLPTALGPVRPDLVDERLGLVVEADSFEWHGDRSALARDCRRYNALVAAGHVVLRFAWEHVMFEQEEVRRTLEAVVRADTRTDLGPSHTRPA